jgi:hypothetical protein
MSDTNNRNKQGPGLQSVRGDTGALPDKGNTTGLDASYPNMGDIDSTARLGSVNGASDAASPSKDMPNPTDDFSGGAHDPAMGGLGGFNAGSDPMEKDRASKTR